MSGNLIIGLVTMSVCLAIECVGVGIMYNILLHLEKKQMIKTTLLGVSSLLLAVMCMQL